jgi:hypothetical protein
MMISIARGMGGAPMPRFYINFQNGDRISKNDEGIELPSLEEARKAALISAREILADNVKGNAKNPLRAVIINGRERSGPYDDPREGCLAEAVEVSWRSYSTRNYRDFAGPPVTACFAVAGTV